MTRDAWIGVDRRVAGAETMSSNPFVETSSASSGDGWERYATPATSQRSVTAQYSGRGVDVHALADDFATRARTEREQSTSPTRAPSAPMWAGVEDGGHVHASMESRNSNDRGAAPRREREVSAEERINETASALIKANAASASSAEEFIGQSDDGAFSDRLAIATAKISTLAAQLKQKTAAAREARTRQDTLDGTAILRRLQEMSSSQLAAPGLVSVQSMRHGEHAVPAQAPGEAKMTKSLSYKLSAATRRTSQRLLQNVGAAEKMDDADFKTLWQCVQKQESILKEISDVSAAYKSAQREVFEHSKRLAQLVRHLVETGDKNNNWEGAPVVAREAALREACKMVDVADALTTRCTPLTEEVFDWNILEPSKHRSKEIPAYKASVAKRQLYMRDMDAFDRQLAALRKRPPKNPDDLALKEEQARRARERFQSFSGKLVEELSIVDGMRYETAYSLVRGFANVQCFNLERQLDIARALRGSGQ